MFIDDTGEVDNAATNEPQRRFASITGVIFEWQYYHETFDPSFRELKFRHFGNTAKGRPPILHRRQLIKAAGAFSKLQNEENRIEWDNAALSMYQRAQYTVITSCVDKIAFYYKHPNWIKDIYLFLVQNTLERYFYFLRKNISVGDVMAEEAGERADRALRKRYTDVYENGTEHIPAHMMQRYLSSKEIKIKPKSSDISGLQMADLLARPSFEHCYYTHHNMQHPVIFSKVVGNILEQEKYYRRDDGDPTGYGRVWRPKN